MFSILPGVLNLSQLNILCTGPTKLCYTQNNELAIHVSRPLGRSPTYGISLKQCNHNSKTFSTLSGVRVVFLISAQLNILYISEA